MRKVLLVTNGIVAVFFLMAFAYTFLGRAHLEQVARTYLAGKTAKAAQPTVDLADKTLNNPLVQKLLPRAKAEAFAQEIAEYRHDPPRYISEHIGKVSSELAPAAPPSALSKLESWKQKVRALYDRALDHLLRDARIFTGSNLVAAILAFILAYQGRGKDPHDQCVISSLLAFAMGLAFYIYVDDFSLLSIISGSLIGWGYPAIIAFFFLRLYFEFRLQTLFAAFTRQASKASA